MAQPFFEEFGFSTGAAHHQPHGIGQIDQQYRWLTRPPLDAGPGAMATNGVERVRVIQHPGDVSAIEPQLAVEELIDPQGMTCEMHVMGRGHSLTSLPGVQRQGIRRLAEGCYTETFMVMSGLKDEIINFIFYAIECSVGQKADFNVRLHER